MNKILKWTKNYTKNIGVGGGGSSSWGNENLTLSEKIISKLDEMQEDKYRSNLYDVEDVVDEEYEDKYYDIVTEENLKGLLESDALNSIMTIPQFSSEELDLAAGYPIQSALGYINKERAKKMTDKIIDKHDLKDLSGLGIENAFKHTYQAALNKNMLGKNFATKIANAHENKSENLTEHREATIMDLHNNALGLSINRPLYMTDKQFAEYVYNIVKEDGYWLGQEEHIPDWSY